MTENADDVVAALTGDLPTGTRIRVVSQHWLRGYTGTITSDRRQGECYTVAIDDDPELEPGVERWFHPSRLAVLEADK